MKLHDLLKKITALPWSITTFTSGPGRVYSLIRSRFTTVLPVEQTGLGDGREAREANAIYVTHLSNVAPEVARLLHLALTQNEDQAQLIQNAYTLLTDIPERKEKSGRLGPPIDPRMARKLNI